MCFLFFSKDTLSHVSFTRYWFMFFLAGGTAVYPFFIMPTMFPGIVLSCSAIVYLIAAIRREKYLTNEELEKADKDLWKKM